MARGGVLAWGVGAVATGAGAALGVTADRLWRSRSTAVRLGVHDDFAETADHELAVITEDGVPLHVEIDEPRADPPANGRTPTVVLVHGYTLNLASWVFQRRALREAGYRVVLFDLRGHGRSEEGEPTSYNIEQLARDLAAVLEQAVPEGPVVLVGHSMGGMTLMSFAAQFPDVLRERVIGAALVATSSGGLAEVNWGLGSPIGSLVHRMGPVAVAQLAGREALLAAALKAGRDVESLVVHHFSFGSHVPMSVVRHTGKMVFSTKMSVVSAFLSELMKHDQLMSLKAFDGIETLVLNGTADKLTPAEHSDAIVSAIHGAEHVVVDDAGHMLMLEHPDLVNEQLIALIARARRAVERPRSGRRVRKTVTDMAARRRVRGAGTGRGPA
ncbi:pimeloyl-ACP methyl ester carboxylesterase [Barrientosiimonas humi]|uniref:Pimeloyl-ACP methyl ester carboxylesterase n=1 Tax=Barrientosiimonas humi TaxID=999931 RepID=A0A542XED0_9MICO|nr:alpha/beta hydrolase [Barrientosiimonas humi]TQL34179.1 pimeloyl-ACP methyl ester carboxylesterase [Barrientosiimonas humi]CAG7574171.1 Non-haem bromoperoxidase BPO-A2 [Barrientosiimonas humi]